MIKKDYLNETKHEPLYRNPFHQRHTRGVTAGTEVRLNA